MNISYRWLRSLAPDLTASVEEVAAQLAARGAPIEELTDLAAGIKDVVVARVEEAKQHPNADRLSLCRVNAGGEILQVVCGAPNVKAGAYYPFAPVGATLPGGLTLRKAKIRGEYSEGMLCSPIEIGLGTDSEGIMELTGEPQIGRPLVDALDLDDWRLDVEVTANRGDLLSHIGVAREVAPAGHHSVQLPAIPGGGPVELSFTRDASAVSGSGATVRIEDPDLCTRYIGVVIRGVTVGPSPEWLQNRLRAVDARPINNVVDATNYVLLELGQPTHAFDLDKLKGQEIVVRRAREGEQLTTLDGAERKLTANMLAICDAEAPTAIAGVMGGEHSEVTDSTRDILLECAWFDPANTRSTRRALGMSTDASYRYERGVDATGMECAVRRCVELILATAGGAVDGPALDVLAAAPEPLSVTLRVARVEHVLGVPFSKARIEELLTPLGFEVTAATDEGRLQVNVPGHRVFDVRREIDLIEEIARTHGYDEFPEVLSPFRPTGVPDHPLYRLEEEIRTLLIQGGSYELQTPAFVATGEVELPNPVSTTESHLRASMMHGVLRSIEHNLARGVRAVRMFEIGSVFHTPTAQGERPPERTCLALAMVGPVSPAHWSGTGGRDADVWDLKAQLEAVAQRAWPGAVVHGLSGEARPTWMGPGGAFEVVHAGRAVGHGGLVLESAIDTPPWAAPVWGLEIELPANPPARSAPVYQPIAPFPGIERDVALLVPHGTTSGQVRDVIREKGGALLKSIELFDLYEGDGIPDDTRSLAYRLTFRSSERTLTDDDVEPVVRRVLKRLKNDLNVHQRG